MSRLRWYIIYHLSLFITHLLCVPYVVYYVLLNLMLTNPESQHAAKYPSSPWNLPAFCGPLIMSTKRTKEPPSVRGYGFSCTCGVTYKILLDVKASSAVSVLTFLSCFSACQPSVSKWCPLPRWCLLGTVNVVILCVSLLFILITPHLKCSNWSMGVVG